MTVWNNLPESSLFKPDLYNELTINNYKLQHLSGNNIKRKNVKYIFTSHPLIVN